MPPFRFAVQLSNAGSAPAWRELARKTEDLGYSTLFMPDHLGDQWAPLVALTVAAEATSGLRVGTLVLDNDFRHPVVVAKEAATLDLLSEGRLELGLGAGWMRDDYDQSGIAYDAPATRVARLAEALSIMKDLWRDGHCDHKGTHYTVNGAQGLPRPHRRPHPLLLIGGGSPTVLALAGREADVVGVNPRLTEGFYGPGAIASAKPEYYDERLEWVRRAAGDRFPDIEIQSLTFVVHVVPNGAELIEQLAPSVGMTPAEAAEAPAALIGSVDELVETLERRRRRWAMNYWVVHEADMDAFAPVVARLTGR
ncbi:MAG TPA: TIGR03621 family F420-dependent LLM class oxidoreductase [Acidimicrobiales bacterium]|nr:TIGR03621 family F420-dependent LLM class oxidoreductase [Acidimicrobiales bacterium]